jgi:copper chaperone CopZ
MKRSIFLGLLLMSSTAFAKEISVKVNGMVCSMCAQGIQKKFSALPEVKGIKVDLDSKVVDIETKENQDLSDAAITKIITEAGYNVAAINRK